MRLENLPLNFTVARSVRKDKKLGDIPRSIMYFKGEALAVFEGDNQDEQIQSYIQTYGYLAEWTRQRHIQGKYVNWTDDLFVDVNAMPKWAGDYDCSAILPRKVHRYRGWVVKIIDTGYCGFPYEYRILNGRQRSVSRTSFITSKTCLGCAMDEVDFWKEL